MSMKKETGTDDVVQIVAENWFNCLKGSLVRIAKFNL